jgi:hypothetical protein
MAAAAQPTSFEGRGACLESYRVDVTGQAWPILVPAALLTSCGAMLICTSFVAHGVLMHRPELTYIGAFCMLSGLTLAVYCMRRLLVEDEYIAALEGGLLLHCRDADAFLAWEDLAAITWDAAREAIVLERRRDEDAAPIALTRPFARTSNDKLAARLDELRRKASFQLIT